MSDTDLRWADFQDEWTEYQEDGGCSFDPESEADHDWVIKDFQGAPMTVRVCDRCISVDFSHMVDQLRQVFEPFDEKAARDMSESARLLMQAQRAQEDAQQEARAAVARETAAMRARDELIGVLSLVSAFSDRGKYPIADVVSMFTRDARRLHEFSSYVRRELPAHEAWMDHDALGVLMIAFKETGPIRSRHERAITRLQQLLSEEVEDGETSIPVSLVSEVLKTLKGE